MQQNYFLASHIRFFYFSWNCFNPAGKDKSNNVHCNVFLQNNYKLICHLDDI